MYWQKIKLPFSFPSLAGHIEKCDTMPFHKYRTIIFEVKQNSHRRGAHVPVLPADDSSTAAFQVHCQLHTNFLANRSPQSEVPSQIPHARFLQRATLVTCTQGHTLSFCLSVYGIPKSWIYSSSHSPFHSPASFRSAVEGTQSRQKLRWKNNWPFTAEWMNEWTVHMFQKSSVIFHS
jgi:hypothetical protein